MSQGKINFFLTGSISCYKACSVISNLAQSNFEIQTIVSKAALEFIGPATLEGLTRKPPLIDIFQSGSAMKHIDLARWADLNLVCPATANSINRIASGLADDALGSLFLASNFSSPWWIAPAMNSQMWLHPATQRSLTQLRDWGVKFLGPTEGSLACGETGPGRLLEPEEIAHQVLSYFEGQVR